MFAASAAAAKALRPSAAVAFRHSGVGVIAATSVARPPARSHCLVADPVGRSQPQHAAPPGSRRNYTSLAEQWVAKLSPDQLSAFRKLLDRSDICLVTSTPLSLGSGRGLRCGGDHKRIPVPASMEPLEWYSTGDDIMVVSIKQPATLHCVTSYRLEKQTAVKIELSAPGTWRIRLREHTHCKLETSDENAEVIAITFPDEDGENQGPLIRERRDLPVYVKEAWQFAENDDSVPSDILPALPEAIRSSKRVDW